MADLSYDQLSLLCFILNKVVGVLGMIGNVLVCATIWHTKTLHTVTNLFILNLALADALTSLCSTLEAWTWSMYPEYIRQHYSGNNTVCTSDLILEHHCKWAHYFFLNSFLAHSVLGLGLMLVERYIGIIRPLHYASFFRRRRIILMLALAWTVPFAMELPRLIYTVIIFRHNNCNLEDSSHRTFAFSCLTMTLFFIPVSAMIAIYIRILANLKQGAKNLRNLGIGGSAEQLLHAHKKVTGSLVVVTLAFFLLVFPVRIFKLLFEIDSDCCVLILLKPFTVMALLNSAINPVMYGFKYRQLRQAFKAMICKRPLGSSKGSSAQTIQSVT